VIIPYSAFSETPPLLYRKYKRKDWFYDIRSYLWFRYYPIEERLFESIRYVDFNSDNAGVYSYEFSSILRDMGAVFGSTIDGFVRNVYEKRRTSLKDYVTFLLNEVKKIEDLGVELKFPINERMVFPFKKVQSKSNKIPWWNAYNKIKHKDSIDYREGNLRNVTNGLASLAILYKLMDPLGLHQSRIISNIGHFTMFTQDEHLVTFPS